MIVKKSSLKKCKCSVSNYTNIGPLCSFHRLTVGGRGSETQLQVGESSNKRM